MKFFCNVLTESLNPSSEKNKNILCKFKKILQCMRIWFKNWRNLCLFVLQFQTSSQGRNLKPERGNATQTNYGYVRQRSREGLPSWCHFKIPNFLALLTFASPTEFSLLTMSSLTLCWCLMATESLPRSARRAFSDPCSRTLTCVLACTSGGVEGMG